MMLSGVGPADHLESVGIKPVVNLPVGRNLEDHLAYHLQWRRRQPGPFHAALRFDRIALSMLTAYLFQSGIATRLPGGIVGFLKSRSSLSQPDLEFIIPMVGSDADFWFPLLKPAYQDSFGVRVQLLGQRSRGEVLLRSANPLERPRILYHSLTASGDLESLREGFKIAWALGHSVELSSFRGARLSPAQEPKTDAEIDEFIRADAFHQFHPSCTCRMGDGQNSVLNADLSVRGVEGLTVVDASAMPHLVSANPNVAIMMMAAKAATIIAGG